MTAVIDSVSTGVPKALTEVTKLGRTLTKRAADVLAYFDRPGTSNGPTEAIKCRRRHFTAYADIWVMPTSEACVLVNRGLAGRLSA